MNIINTFYKSQYIYVVQNIATIFDLCLSFVNNYLCMTLNFK